jgi:hypothetical protein
MAKKRKKRGRPRTGRDPMIGVRLPARMLKKIGKIAEARVTNRSGAIRWPCGSAPAAISGSRRHIKDATLATARCRPAPLSPYLQAVATVFWGKVPGPWDREGSQEMEILG